MDGWMDGWMDVTNRIRVKNKYKVLHSLMAQGTMEFFSLLVLHLGRSIMSLYKLHWWLMTVCKCAVI